MSKQSVCVCVGGGEKRNMCVFIYFQHACESETYSHFVAYKEEQRHLMKAI